MTLRTVLRRPRAGRAAWITAGVLVGIACGMAAMLMTEGRAPLTVLNQNDVGRARIIDGMLVVDFDFYRRSDCNSEIASWLWRWDDSPGHGRRVYVVPFGTAMMSFSDPSPYVQSIVIARSLPRGLRSGEWFLRYKYLDHCGLFPGLQKPTKRVMPDIPVQVTDADLAAR